MEHRAGADQGDQVWGVDGVPSGLCGVDQLVGHGNSRSPGAGALGDLGPQPDGGKRGLDRVGGAQVDPVLGGILVELQQDVAYRSSYAATKMGMIGMTRTLALELGPSGIRVNCILPGNVAGERTEEVFAAQAQARGITIEEAKQQVLALSPLRTQVAAQSILNVALFLASDFAPYMTGQDINVTAGMIMF
jgi:NAD(P)-dependent dehydrogenase (short-subunit alcohol dehydrogenase family)